MKKIEVGDSVYVRAEVYEVDGDRAYIGVTWVRESEIIHVEPRPLKVGDEVRFKQGLYRGEIRHIENDFAMVRFNDACIAAKLNDLVRVQ